MWWVILAIILALWLIGLITGGLIRLLLVVAGVVFLIQLLIGRWTAV